MQADSKSEDPSMMRRLQQRYKLKSAMSTGSRRLGRIYNLFSSSTDDGSRKQFRVKKTKCFCPTRYVCSLAGLDAALNWAVLRFLDKVYTSSMLSLVLVFVVFFYFWIIAFACVMYGLMVHYPECSSNNPLGSDNQSIWQDAFALSWTTFSTVGYGHIYPSLSQQEEWKECAGLISITSFESFFGVIYAGSCGALLFARIIRASTEAQVVYSEAITISNTDDSPILTEVHSNEEDEFHDTKEDEEGIAQCSPEFSCPIMTIRILNKFANDPDAGVLIDAEARVTLNGVMMPKAMRNSRKIKKNKLLKAVNASKEKEIQLLNPRRHLFSRIWEIKHELNVDSPLLTESFKNEMKDNNDKWPRRLSRKNLDGIFVSFGSLVVSIKATSESSAAEVFSHYVYNNEQMYVNFSPVELLYTGKKDSDSYFVDFELIDDIIDDELEDIEV